MIEAGYIKYAAFRIFFYNMHLRGTVAKLDDVSSMWYQKEISGGSLNLAAFSECNQAQMRMFILCNILPPLLLLKTIVVTFQW